MHRMNKLAIVLERETINSDFNYEPARSKVVGKIWIDLKNAKQTTAQKADTTQIVYSHVAFARYQKQITENHELKIGNDFYGIVALINVDERSEFLELHLIKEIGDGS